jgi:glycosyltransferase involved in cell wall biosynthesis
MTEQPRVGIVGAVPPPYGGVTVHLLRALERFRSLGIAWNFYDTRGRSDKARNIFPGGRTARWLVRFLLTCEERVVHLHASRPDALICSAPLLASRRRRLILTLHNENLRRAYERSGPAKRAAYRFGLRLATRIVCVNPGVMDWLQDLKVPPARLLCIPAFIPPSASELSESNLPREAAGFLSKYNPIVGSHGWFGYFVNGHHVYSFDLLGTLLQRLLATHPTAGMYTVVSSTYEENHRSEILEWRKRQGLDQRWLILETPFSAASVFKKSDVFVRPTVTEGDSVSVRECLALGTPVIASDCVPRPEGCVLFRTRDADDLVASTTEVLENLPFYRRRCAEAAVHDASLPLADLYQELLA